MSTLLHEAILYLAASHGDAAMVRLNLDNAQPATWVSPAATAYAGNVAVVMALVDSLIGQCDQAEAQLTTAKAVARAYEAGH
ncbi:MAG: hypothetical protein LBR19_02730 [Bifidobacteriaceae bacterium]|nr:hypothetical protein [Bifidobacteriaceae bacterium]